MSRRSKKRADKTDWTAYYRRTPVSARVTRSITGSYLQRLIGSHLSKSSPHIIELGGANSCFMEGLIASLRPSLYSIIDSNASGLEKTVTQREDGLPVQVIKDDVLDLAFTGSADVVLSVGLIEHFTPEDTIRAIRTHFSLAKEGGLVVMSFPTPTLLYRATRRLSEFLGLWMFPDERPLTFQEVLETASEFGDVLDRRIIWPVFLTQGLVIMRKKRTPSD